MLRRFLLALLLAPALLMAAPPIQQDPGDGGGTGGGARVEGLLAVPLFQPTTLLLRLRFLGDQIR